jgi:hypothetical protein
MEDDWTILSGLGLAVRTERQPVEAPESHFAAHSVGVAVVTSRA